MEIMSRINQVRMKSSRVPGGTETSARRPKKRERAFTSLWNAHQSVICGSSSSDSDAGEARQGRRASVRETGSIFPDDNKEKRRNHGDGRRRARRLSGHDAGYGGRALLPGDQKTAGDREGPRPRTEEAARTDCRRREATLGS